MITGKLPDPEEIRDALEIVAQYGIPASVAAGIFDVGTGSFLKYFEQEILDDLVTQGGSTCRFFEGAYGSGKSHFLQLLGDLALERGMAFVKTELSHSLSLEDWRLITLHILQNLKIRIGNEQVRSLPAILEVLGRFEIVNTEVLRKVLLPHPGFRQAMLLAVERSFLKEQAWILLRRFLLGENVRIKELQKAGITRVKNPLSARNAEQVLNTVLGGLFYLGIPGTMLLFDENEKTLVSRRQIPAKKIQIAANLMRRLIDSCTTDGLVGTVTVFAILPGFLEDCTRSYPALGQRLQMVRNEKQKPAWRWPVLPVTAVNTVQKPEYFLSQVIDNFERIILHCGGNVDGFRQNTQFQGNSILRKNAGSGYRRELLKMLATFALEQIGGSN